MRLSLTTGALLFGLMYVNVGVQHFTNTAWFNPIVPAILGDPTIWVHITGVMEIAIGVGLILPRTRRYAGLGSFVFLIGIYWANLNMWINNIPLDGKTYANHWHVLRLLAQLGMMGFSYAIWRGSMAEEHATKAT
ncbi:MAG: DoxX family membrane protein [Candidatus Poseidoniales archaeon]|nr:MAG: DoxX family membrane protein [Candidatus Poseidoniales archaeon]